jgi:ankyrin repeat protein
MEAVEARNNNKEIVQFLLTHGANPGIMNSHYLGTARDIAARRHDDEILALLDRAMRKAR